jgi:diphthamide synthase subunit DPH2
VNGNRFVFSLSGRIAAASDADVAAKETIRRLALDHRALTQYRKEAIDATLRKHRRGRLLDKKSAQRRLAKLEQTEAGSGRLEPFCFVLKQALLKHIQRLEAIRQSKAKRR